MHHRSKHRLALFLTAACSLLACGARDTPPPPPAEVTATVETDEERPDTKADRPRHWTVKADELQMWLHVALEPKWERNETTWLLRGEVNEELATIRVYDAGGRRFDAEVKRGREFVVELSGDEALDVVSGERLYFDFFPVDAPVPIFHGTARYAPRYTRWGGSTRLYVYRAINAVQVGNQLRFRSRATAQRGHELLRIFTDDDLAPLVVEEKPRKYRFDWSPRALLLAADPPTEPVYFEIADTGDTVHRKEAGIDLRLIQIGLSTGAPFDAWPPLNCEQDVLDCLLALEDDFDTETCGYANQVEACWGTPREPLGADEHRFRADLAEEIERWYEGDHREGRTSGARTRDAALRKLAQSDVHQLDPAQNRHSFAYDLEYFDVFWVADPVFRDSPRVWYGVYEPSGILHTIFAVN